MKVVFTVAATADLRDIGDRIAADNPVRAGTFVAELIAKAHSLSDYSYRFPIVARYETAGIRRCVHGNYLIFYRIDDSVVRVIHFLHGAQDYKAVLDRQSDAEESDE